MQRTAKGMATGSLLASGHSRLALFGAGRDDSPGPCQYSANESLLSKKGVPFSRSSRSARTGRVNAFSESPGPCAYNVPQGGYRAPASFPRQKRTAASSITESSPGPCAYQPTYPNQRQNNCGTFGRCVETHRQKPWASLTRHVGRSARTDQG